MQLLRKPRKPLPFHIIGFLAPATLIYTMFMIYPLLDSLRISFFSQSIEQPSSFVGLQHYLTLLTDPLWAPRFWGALRNNCIFFLMHIAFQNPIALLLATLLSSEGRGRAIYRTLIFIPTVLSVVIVGFIWQLILNPLWGIARDSMHMLSLDAYFQPWLGLPKTALLTLSLISVWQFVGIPMILFYTALIAIPDELVQAAHVDGANNWIIFWRIKFPLILPTVGLVNILTFVGNWNAFDLIYTVKGALAGPNFATDIMGTLFYRTFFGFQLQSGNPAMGATLAAVLLLIVLSGILLYTFVWQRYVPTYEL